MHMRVFEQHALGGPTLAIHVGCHYGSTIESGGDLYGDAVNVAARVAGVAKVGQIIATQDVIARLEASLQEKTRMLDRVAVKGKREPVQIHEFIWQDSRGSDHARHPALRGTGAAPAARVRRSRAVVRRQRRAGP